MDHRWGYRVRTDLDVYLQLAESASAPRVATLRDISVSGARLRANTRPALLSRVRICSAWESRAGAMPGALEGFVVRFTPDGFSLQWMQLAPAALESIIHAILGRYSHSHRPRSRAMGQADIPCGWMHSTHPILVFGHHHAVSGSDARRA